MGKMREMAGIGRPHRRLPPNGDSSEAPNGPPQEESQFIPAPEGMFVCPNGHESQVAVNIQGVEEKIDGTYCMICWMQFVTQHTSRVRLERFED